MEPEEIKELEELRVKCLKIDGKPKKRAKPADVKWLKELQAKYDAEHSMNLPDDAQIKGGTKEILLNVCGKQIIKTVPA